LNTSTVTLRVIGGDEKESLKSEIALERTSSTYKRPTRPLVREGALQEQDRNCHTSNKDLVVSPKWVLYSKTDWPAGRRSYIRLRLRLLILLVNNNSVHTSQETHYIFARNINRLTLLKGITAVYCENHMKHIPTVHN
jgi:hypothetical protein